MSAPILESSPRATVYTFKLLARQKAALQDIQKQTGATVAEQIRRGIDLWIAKQRRAK